MQTDNVPCIWHVDSSMLFSDVTHSCLEPFAYQPTAYPSTVLEISCLEHPVPPQKKWHPKWPWFQAEILPPEEFFRSTILQGTLLLDTVFVYMNSSGSHDSQGNAVPEDGTPVLDCVTLQDIPTGLLTANKTVPCSLTQDCIVPWNLKTRNKRVFAFTFSIQELDKTWVTF